MSSDILIVLALALVAIVLLITERLPVDLVALIVMAVLILTRVITPSEGLSGFSSTATITVGAMFVLSAGLYKSGAVNNLGAVLARIGKKSYWLGLLMLMLVAGGASAFVNNTAVVAILLPITMTMAGVMKVSPSRMLIPLSFASMFGGVCTVIGTSTNILVSSIAEQHGQRAIAMFEVAPLGLCMFAAGMAYMALIGVRLIPDRRKDEDLTMDYGLEEYLTDIVLLPSARSVGKAVRESPLVLEVGVSILGLRRDDQSPVVLTPDTVLLAGDVLRVQCSLVKIRELQDRAGIRLLPGHKWRDEDLETDRSVLVETVISPNSDLVGKTLVEAKFRAAYSSTVLAIRHSGRLLRENLDHTPLAAGDALLLQARKDQLDVLKRNPAFVVVTEAAVQKYNYNRIIPSVLIIIGVITLAALNIVPIVAGSVVGCVLMVVFRCITLDEAYRAIQWRTIFLLAGILSLGVALEKTGAAASLSNGLIMGFGSWGPVAMLSAFYLVTSLLTETMSNQAAAVMLAPIAIAAADRLGVDSRPFLMAVTFAASASFMTPVGYQTNTMIYEPGRYRFADFVRVGTPLNIIFWIMATLLIPRFWPF